MYAFIWRKLPFGLPGKIVGSTVLLLATVALLWFVAFPWAEPILPFDDVQVGTGTEGGGPGDFAPPEAPAGPGTSVSPGGQPGDGHDLPYNTESNNPVKTSGR
jgi:hypothetical protein